MEDYCIVCALLNNFTASVFVTLEILQHWLLTCCSFSGWQTDKLEALKEKMIMVREIFRDKEATEFIIVTIPTV